MVLNNVAKFHLILIKIVRLRERTSLGVAYIRTDVLTDVRTDGWTDRRMDRGYTKCPGHFHGGGIHIVF